MTTYLSRTFGMVTEEQFDKMPKAQQYLVIMENASPWMREPIKELKVCKRDKIVHRYFYIDDGSFDDVVEMYKKEMEGK